MNAPLLTFAAVVVAGATLAPRPPRRALADPPGDRLTDAPRSPVTGARRALRRGRAACDPAELAAWCDALARSVRGGGTIRHAVATVPPPGAVRAAMEPVHHALDRGVSLAEALRAAGDGSDGTPAHLDLVLVVLRACAHHGGAAGEPIDRCAAALRQRAALIAERSSQSAQARLSAVVMTLLPVALLAVLVLTSTPVRHAVASPLGATVVALGGAANVTGWLWMRRLIGGGARWR